MSSSSFRLYKKYGTPNQNKVNCKRFEIPYDLRFSILPNVIHCHKDFINPLLTALTNLRDTGFWTELKTYDGCYVVRAIRGYEKKLEDLLGKKKIAEAMQYMSNHSWGTAIDFNAKENGIGMNPKFSAGFVKCFIDAGFVWGGNFERKDGMHFELKI